MRLLPLQKAVDESGADANRIANSTYLEPLHSDPRFGDLLTKAMKNEDDAYARFPYEQDTAKIAGVRVVEGNPSELGVRLPDPDGPGRDRRQARSRPRLVSSDRHEHERHARSDGPRADRASRVALMVFTQKDFTSWSAMRMNPGCSACLNGRWPVRSPGSILQAAAIGPGSPAAGGQMAMQIYNRTPPIPLRAWPLMPRIRSICSLTAQTDGAAPCRLGGPAGADPSPSSARTSLADILDIGGR